MTEVARMKDYGLINHLRRWGLKVESHEGWRTRGRPYNFYPKAIICHHTASNRNSGNFASESTVVNGRADLHGPLCQVLLGRNGTVKMIAAGYANHAGYGGPLAGMPANMGNTYAIGIEAENDGSGEPWSKAQLNAYYRLCAALMVWIGTKDVSRVIGHKEWAPGRKIDPYGITMSTFRSNVKKALAAGPVVQTVSLAKLQPKKTNNDILNVKKALVKKGFDYHLDMNGYFGTGLLREYAKWQKHLGYSDAQATGIPDKNSLQKLGFHVVP